MLWVRKDSDHHVMRIGQLIDELKVFLFLAVVMLWGGRVTLCTNRPGWDPPRLEYNLVKPQIPR